VLIASALKLIMPSGKTHDFITLLIALPTFLVAYLLTQNPLFSLIVTITTLFGGLMFGPDLDINSRQYQRWGPLRIFWWPYRNMFSHRSRFTHGLFLGPIIRIVYFFIIITLLLAMGLYLRELWRGADPTTREKLLIIAAQRVVSFLRTIDRNLILAAVLGCWWGAASHTIVDLGVSAVKRISKFF
jgi:uncharacterized metal-binding protein